MASKLKPKRSPKRKQPLASAGSTQPEKIEAAATMRLARDASYLTIGTFAIFSAYLVYDSYFDNSVVINSPVARYAFPLMAVSIVLIGYQRILRTGRPFRLARIERISKANIAVAAFVVLLGIVSIVFTKSYSSAIQTQLFVVGTLAVLAVAAVVAGNLTYDILKSRYLRS